MFASGMNAAEVLLPSVRSNLEVFIAHHWCSERATERAPSLARARRRISILADAVASSKPADVVPTPVSARSSWPGG